MVEDWARNCETLGTNSGHDGSARQYELLTFILIQNKANFTTRWSIDIDSHVVLHIEP